MGHTLIIIIACATAAIFCVWREFVRSNKRNLWLRVLAVIIIVAALGCIILPVNYHKELNADINNQAVILTAGFDADSVNNYPAIPLYTFDKTLKKENPKAILLNGISDLADIKPKLEKISIIGYGLDEDQLSQLDSIPVNFIAAKKPAGIQSASWNTHLKTGETLTIQGSYNNTSGDVINLVLKGLGTSLDSAAIVPDKISAFELKAKPRNKGRAVYRLLEIDGKDTLNTESVPLEVIDTKRLNVLILAGTPDFENKFLKDWLAANGYGVAVRSMISQDKYSQEFANIPQQSLKTVTPALLGKFDVVFSTLDVLKTLPPGDAGALRQQVTQKGLGLIVRSDSTNRSNSWLQRDFPVSRSANAVQIVSGFKIQGQDAATSKLLTDAVYITPQNYTQPLVTDQQGKLIAGNILQGAGREVFTTLNNSHNWMLSGNENDYSAYWSLLIGKAARPVPVNSQWTVKTPVPYVNGHTRIQLQTSAQNPQLKINAGVVSPVRQPDLPFAYEADYWPAHAGWQQAQQNSEAPQWWYVYPQSEWMSLRYLNNMADTRAFVKQQTTKTSVTKQIHRIVAIAVPKIYFYILLLLACTYLWAEAKFKF